MWNPGDDFVRQGVIAVLRRIYAPRPLNLFFYNFSADVLPPYGKLGDRGNNIAAGDLEGLGDTVDAVVIAGLSAGREIKDLYNWVIEAGLTDRVYMIGAGYENSYVEKHCSGEPEATIFRSARFITGRTEKTPEFLKTTGTPYAHIGCPSLLSVERVKDVPEGARVRRIGFSIQLPHDEGIVNQATGRACSELAIETMLRLAETHDVTLVAHHKTEYTAFAPRFNGTRVKVVFQSFFQDLAETYCGFDAVITTRLHAGLYANAHGIPAIIINDTDRHTHAATEFPYAVCVSDRDGVDRAIAEVFASDLAATADALQLQKDNLVRTYVDTLAPSFATTPVDSRVDLAAAAASAWGQPAVKHRAVSIISKLTADHWLEGNIRQFGAAAGNRETWFDTLTVLNWWARAMQPRTYLEIGVRRGRSMAQVLSESPATHAYGFDLWLPGYGSIPEQGIVAENPGPEFVADELARIGAAAPAGLTRGNSHDVVPAFFDDATSPQEIDLLLVDGDHTDDGARKDLAIAFERVAPGGAIIFDDLVHPSHPGLRGVWEEFKQQHPDWLFVEDEARSGTGVAVRPPFDSLKARLERSEREPVAAGSEPGAERLMRRLVKPGMVAVDAGAHVGRYTESLSGLVGEGGTVLSIEASPGSAARLRDRVRAHGLDNVAVEQVAVSDQEDAATLHEYGESYSSWSTLGTPVLERTPGEASSAITVASEATVRTVRLDALLDLHGIKRVDFLKLDVEGAEPAALRGLADRIASGSIRFIQFEVSARTIAGMGARPGEIFDLLRAHGYRCHTITDAGGIGDEVHDSHARHTQYIAIAPDARPPAATAADTKTPIHFFTIVLNGKPFIEHHAEVFSQIDGPWHWHIIEGVGTHVGDTSWCAKRGGAVTSAIHANGLSNDGTTAAIDAIKARYPNNVTVYRKPPGGFWNGKLEMVSAPLANIHEPCILWQVDVDEIWTAEQIKTGRRLFAERPLARSAYFRCHYFVGPDRVITSRDTYGNHTSYEWLRAWRFTPGCRWLAHEPPRLHVPNPAGGTTDLAEIHPIMHDETEAAGLVFQHFAYTTEAQLRFKETYYGYAGAVEQWRGLQAADSFPVRLADHFGWVRDGAVVELASSIGIEPILMLGDGGGVVEVKNAEHASLT